MHQTGMRFMMWMLGCVLLSGVVLCGCGKKGPLYLPDEANAPKQGGSQAPLSAVPKPEK